MVSSHTHTENLYNHLVISHSENFKHSLTLDDFRVAFVETMYTVPESGGSVPVCVNLTVPTIDILDEFVLTQVLNEPNSIYIPPNSSLASKSVKTLSRAFSNSMKCPQLRIFQTSLGGILWQY